MSGRPIGMFDSGFGGLTVMKALREQLPHEDIVYLGDTARLPYGTKSKSTILRYSLENSQFLIDQGVKLIVVACHTACSLALDELQHRFSIPIIGVSTASIDAVVNQTRGEIAVLGTRGTIQSGMYQKKLSELLPKGHVISIPCQLLVHLVEEGYIDHPATHLILQEYLQPVVDHPVDTLLLGCTHFPLLLDPIQQIVGPSVNLIDPAEACAAVISCYLRENHLLNSQEKLPSDTFFVTDQPEKFQAMGELFLGHSCKNVVNFFLP